MYLQNENRLLRIYRVQSEHAGRFRCTAQNSAGEARREYHIVVQGELIKQLLHWQLVYQIIKLGKDRCEDVP